VTSGQAFHIEQHGIDFIAETERWATPRNIAGMWAGSAINVEYFVYGALLMGFGFSFATAVTITIVGNLSFLLLGVASLQGQESGTTAFTTSRAAFGTRGSRVVSFFNWVTQLGFETEGIILIAGAVLVLFRYMGVQLTSPGKVVVVIVATAVQAVLPYFGHATMVKVLKMLIVPFVIIFAVFAVFIAQHAHPSHVKVFASGWESWTAGLAFTIALSGLGWTECGNDYTRYLPRETRKGAVVGWIFLGTALPEIVMMVLGALAFSFLSNSTTWNSANPFDALYHQAGLPSGFVVVFLLVAVVQLFGINSLDLYSSGVSVQAMGLPLRRYQAVVMDSVIVGALSIWATLGSTFATFMKGFVGIIIVWIAPWFGVFVTDWLLRRCRYDATDLQRTDAKNRYWGRGGFHVNAFIAFAGGLVAATTGYAKAPPPVAIPPHWMTPFSNSFGAFYCHGTPAEGCGSVPGWFGGADLSILFGIGTAAGLYLMLELITGSVKRQHANLEHRSSGSGRA
jgi:nucleobase:cation symporter-1, NCS1 family